MTEASGTRIRRLLLFAPVPRERRRRTLLIDLLVGFVLVAFTAVAGASSGQGADATAWTFAATVYYTAALALRRLAPVLSGLAVAVAGAPVLVAVLLQGDVSTRGATEGLFQSTLVASLISLYALAAYAPRPASLAGLGGSTVAALLLAWVLHVGMDTRGAVFAAVTVVVLLVGIWSMGRSRWSRLAQMQLLTERNEALQAERSVAADRAADAERTRIAREMHDIVAHSLSAVIAQADGGRYAARADPAAGVEALTTVSATARRALADMRSLLGVLRDDGPASSGAPPGVADVAELVRGESKRGTRAVFAEHGTPVALPPALGLTVYRIVQESLTNARLHAAPGAQVRVELDWGPGEVTVTTTDSAPDGRREDAGAGGVTGIPSGGRGVLGMRERAAVHGGTLEARPTATGFRVRARLPIEREGGPEA